MSLIGSLNAAVGGMNAQASALSAISDNVANSQTVGFKETDTAFADFVTQSSATFHSPGAVIGLPQYSNSVEGAVTQVANPTSLAISGAGFFAVQLPTGPATFSPQQFYTRAGDFKPDNSGNLVNSSGYVLDGWPATNAAGTTFNSNGLGPLTISQDPSAPVPTANVTLSANLPETPPTGTTSYSSTVQVNDAGGDTHNLTMNWTQVAANQWNLAVNSPTATPLTQAQGPFLVTFGTTPADAGTITSIAGATGATGTPATISLTPDFGKGAQPITLNLGQYGSTSGVTQFAGSDYSVASQTQDGSAQGNFSSVTIRPTGDVVINYDNGAVKTIARVPLAHFGSPDSLQQQDGQAFTATIASGAANITTAGTGGTGTLVVGAEEGSNVDIATQFTQMIVAQRAYTANSKVVTTANSMMQDALNMIQG